VVAGLVMGTLEKFYHQPSLFLPVLYYSASCSYTNHSTKDNKKRGYTHADVVHTRLHLS
jgi:hypothetical protein